MALLSSRNLFTALERSKSGQEFLIYPNFISFIPFSWQERRCNGLKLLWSTSKASLIFFKGWEKALECLRKWKIRHFWHFEDSKADVLTLKIHSFDFIIFSNVNKILLIIDPVFILYYCIFSWQPFHRLTHRRPPHRVPDAYHIQLNIATILCNFDLENFGLEIVPTQLEIYFSKPLEN